MAAAGDTTRHLLLQNNRIIDVSDGQMEKSSFAPEKEDEDQCQLCNGNNKNKNDFKG